MFSTTPTLCAACGRASVSTPGAFCDDCASFAGALPSPVPAPVPAIPAVPARAPRGMFTSTDAQMIAVPHPSGWVLFVATANDWGPAIAPTPVFVHGATPEPPPWLRATWKAVNLVQTDAPAAYGWVDPGIVPGVCEQCTGHMDARDGGICPSCLADPDRTRIP